MLQQFAMLSTASMFYINLSSLPVPTDLSVKILGSETKKLFDDEPHNYVCVLTGTPEEILESERHAPRWWTLDFTQKATSIGNRIVVGKEKSLGKHSYECVYRRPWIEKRARLEFTITRKSNSKQQEPHSLTTVCVLPITVF